MRRGKIKFFDILNKYERWKGKCLYALTKVLSQIWGPPFTSPLGQGYGGASSDYARTPPANISRPSQFTNPGSRDSRDISKTTSRELNNASWIWPAYKGGKRFRAEGLKGEDDRASSLSRVT